MAERLARLLRWRCVVIDKREHIGGNAHDAFDSAGVLVHSYGPHYFRTNSARIIDYLSQFTAWHPVEYSIKSRTAGRYWSFPVNLNTYEEMVGHPATEEEFAAYLERVREPIERPANSEEVMLASIGRELYERFFEGYTLKHWKRHPRELDASVCGRIPVRLNRDNRYLSESFQALPRDGYTAMFGSMLQASAPTRFLPGMPLEEARRHFTWKHLIYSGPIDSYFGECHGRLPWRSLRFEPESFTAAKLRNDASADGPAGFWQPAMQVNYPDRDIPFTRIVEIKHATGQRIDATTIVREYPADYEETGEPYYPIPAPDAKRQYRLYRELAEREENTTFIGRLATYRYYNMDQIVGMALKKADDLVARFGGGENECGIVNDEL